MENTSTVNRILSDWQLTLMEPLYSRNTITLKVERQKHPFILKGYPLENQTKARINYELTLMRALIHHHWPVAELIQTAVCDEGYLWCLYSFLPGQPKQNAIDRYYLGELLATFHLTTKQLTHLGQNPGQVRTIDVVEDKELETVIKQYERLFPYTAKVLLWHREKIIDAFTNIDQASLELVIIHGDFAPWNMHFKNDRLTGLFDFEAVNLDFLISDFALSWRGVHDEVIKGYESITPLSSLNQHLIVPIYWAWLYRGLKAEMKAMINGHITAHEFKWQVDHLIRRSSYFGRFSMPFPR